MSKEYDNTNRGVLFDNDRKETDKHPDFKGTINVGGADYWLSAWLAPEDSKAYLRLSVQPKEARQERGQQTGNTSSGRGRQAPPAPTRNDDPFPDDDIPFVTNHSVW